MNNQFWQTIGNQIKQIRNQRGMTQTDLGEKIGGLGKSYISDLERGETTCSLTRLNEIADILDCDLNVEIRER